MMTANEARKNTEKSRADFEKMMLAELVCRAEKTIKESSTTGQSCCNISTVHYSIETVKNAINYLETLGYNCKHQIGFDCYSSYRNCLKISW